MTVNDITWPGATASAPEVTSFHRKSPGSSCKSGKLGFCLLLAATGGSHVTGDYVAWPGMTGSDLEVTSSPQVT